jgi:hypothetical protein
MAKTGFLRLSLPLLLASSPSQVPFLALSLEIMELARRPMFWSITRFRRDITATECKQVADISILRAVPRTNKPIIIPLEVYTLCDIIIP